MTAFEGKSGPDMLRSSSSLRDPEQTFPNAPIKIAVAELLLILCYGVWRLT